VITLSKVFVYPIKALPGVALDSVEITQSGTLTHDRRWALVDKRGSLINGKNNKQIFLLRPSFDLQALTVRFCDNEEFSLEDANSLSDYFSDKLHQAIVLKEDKYQGFPDDMNASGPTIVSQASLEAVAAWYRGLSVDDVRARFRINLEVSSVPAFWEDQIFQRNRNPKTIRIGQVAIQASNPCARCSVPIKHPESGLPYDNFYEIFINKREHTRPEWADVECFEHWYRLSVNTRIPGSEAGGVIQLGDCVSLINTD
jgi:uncharacterized protein YcbX